MRRALLLAAAATLAACSGPAGPDGPIDDGPPPPAETGYPDYETFDPSAYDAPPRRSPRTIEHDVPARLMEGRVEVPDDGGERTVDGFRIQVFSGEDRRRAEDVRAEAVAWWRGVQGQPGAPLDIETSIVYVQPYYRVRLGGFEFREDAEAALAFVRERFGEAFIVPDRVTIRE